MIYGGLVLERVRRQVAKAGDVKATTLSAHIIKLIVLGDALANTNVADLALVY